MKRKMNQQDRMKINLRDYLYRLSILAMKNQKRKIKRLQVGVSFHDVRSFRIELVNKIPRYQWPLIIVVINGLVIRSDMTRGRSNCRFLPVCRAHFDLRRANEPRCKLTKEKGSLLSTVPHSPLFPFSSHSTRKKLKKDRIIEGSFMINN